MAFEFLIALPAPLAGWGGGTGYCAATKVGRELGSNISAVGEVAGESKLAEGRGAYWNGPEEREGELEDECSSSIEAAGESEWTGEVVMGARFPRSGKKLEEEANL